MRIASFNVENLFERAKAFNLQEKDAARIVLEQYARLTDLFNEPVYCNADKAEMVDLLAQLGLAERDDGASSHSCGRTAVACCGARLPVERRSSPPAATIGSAGSSSRASR